MYSAHPPEGLITLLSGISFLSHGLHFFFVKVKQLFYESPEAASLPASLTTCSPLLAGWTIAITMSGDWEPSPTVSTQ